MESLVKKLVQIQSTLKAPKNQYNSFGKYKYRSCEDIVEAVKPLLADNDLFMFISDKIVFHSELRCYVEATVTVTDGKDSVTATGFAREATTKKGMDDSQITGATSSYARKYALNGMFGIDDTKDADATNDHGKAPKKSSQSNELLDVMADGDDLATAVFWRENQDKQEQLWRGLDKDSQNKLKAILSQYPAQQG